MWNLLTGIGMCASVFGCFLFSYLDTQNTVTDLKLRLPQQEKALGALREESKRLRYEIGQFERPDHLIELAHRPEFGHLKHPLLKEILTVPEAIAANE